MAIRRSSRALRDLVLVASIGLACAACSASFSIGGESVEDAAVDVIEGELAEQIGLALTADCPAVPDPEVGTAFSCTATTPSGDLVSIAGEVDREDHIDLTTTNVIRGDVAGTIGRAIEDEVAGSGGGDDLEVDCGDETIVADQNNSFSCGLRGPGTTGGAEAIVTVTDFDTGNFEYALEGFEPVTDDQESAPASAAEETSPPNEGEFTISGLPVPEAAAAFIEGELADQLGLALTASCPPLTDPGVGTTFSCKATTPAGDVVLVDGLVDRVDHVDLQTSNVVRGDVLGDIAASVESDAAAAGAGELNVECGSDSLVLDDSNTFACALSGDGAAPDASVDVTITDFDQGRFDYELNGFDGPPTATDGDDPSASDTPTVEAAAIDLIEGPLAEQLNLPMEAICPTDISPDVGTEFVCTGRTDDGEIVVIEGVVDREDNVNLETLNVIRADLVEQLEDAAADALEPQTGPVVIDCGGTARVLGSADELRCGITSADGANTATALIQITDLDTLAFVVEIE